MLGQVGLGGIAQAGSIPGGYIIGGLITGLALPVVYLLRRRGDPADVIIGTAGKRGACAAQGLPAVSSLDANSHVVTLGEV
jgi:hypothetical protein